MQKEIVQTTLRFSAERHEQLRIEVAKRRLKSLQQAVDEALNLWMGAPAAAAAPPPPAGLSREEAHQVNLFVDFLRHGEQGSVELVKHALELHGRRQRALRKRSSA